MRIHHLNCGALNPPSQRLTEGHGSPWRRGRAVCHCLLIETPDGLVLVDTGLGAADVTRPFERLGTDVAMLLHPTRDMAFTAARQIWAAGLDPDDVTDVFMTHLDVDHRGGLVDFPNATVHVSRKESLFAEFPRTAMDRRRYRGDWHRDIRWDAHPATGAMWNGLSVAFDMDTGDGRMLLVELPGHSRGHCGVAVEVTSTDGPSRWLLHVGDAVQHRAELETDGRVPWGIRAFNAAMQADREARHASVEAIRQLNRRSDVDVICAHDPVMFDRWSTDLPASR